jgi:polar amino acid transport system permease protein
VSGHEVGAAPTNLSPAPRSRGIAISALAAAVGVLLVVAFSSFSSISQATNSGLRTFCWIFGAVGLAAGMAVAWYAAAAFFASSKSGLQERTQRILESRFSADVARQDSSIALGLALSVFVLVSLLYLITMNNGAIQKTFFRLDLMLQSFADVASAFKTNIILAVSSQVIVLIVGLVLAVARMAPGRGGSAIRALAICYIDLFRAVPAIIVIYLIGFGLPIANIPYVSRLPPEFFAILALSLTYSAYVAETYRSGIEAIHQSQWSATRSLGFSYTQTLRYIILPQAIRNVTPPLLSSFIGLQKDTALVNVIGTMDAFNQAKFYASANFNLSSVTVVAVLFFSITIPQTRFVDWLMARNARKRKAV